MVLYHRKDTHGVIPQERYNRQALLSMAPISINVTTIVSVATIIISSSVFWRCIHIVHLHKLCLLLQSLFRRVSSGGVSTSCTYTSCVCCYNHYFVECLLEVYPHRAPTQVVSVATIIISSSVFWRCIHIMHLHKLCLLLQSLFRRVSSGGVSTSCTYTSCVCCYNHYFVECLLEVYPHHAPAHIHSRLH